MNREDLEATIASLREGDVVEVDVEYGTHRATVTGAVWINLEGRPHVWDIMLPLARFLLAVRVIERASLPLPTEPGAVVDVEWNSSPPRRDRLISDGRGYWTRSDARFSEFYLRENARVLKVHDLPGIGEDR